MEELSEMEARFAGGLLIVLLNDGDTGAAIMTSPKGVDIDMTRSTEAATMGLVGLGTAGKGDPVEIPMGEDLMAAVG